MNPADDELPVGDLETMVAAAIAAEEQGPAVLATYLDGLGAASERVRAVLKRLQRVPVLGDGVTLQPSRVGEFRLLDRLGSGGMGVVYLAEQESLRRRVAVKLVRADLLLFPDTRERFRREIEAAAAVRHPGVVPILAVGEQDNLPWFAMELVDGRSLADLLRELQGRDPARLGGADLRAAIGGDPAPGRGSTVFARSWWEAGTALALQVAEAIAHAHGCGVVHRDLKPSNLMLTPDGRAIVLDFGLARIRGDGRLTRSGGGAGSPLYMSPEQHRGEAIDERTDVYSLAVTLAELLTLRAPYPADDPERLRGAVLAGAFSPLREHLPALPRALEIVVHKAMDPDRRHRYASMAAFADDLRAVLAHEPIAGRPLPLAVRAGRFLRRHPLLLGGALAAAAVLVAVPTALYFEQRKSSAALELASRRAQHNFDVAMQTVEQLLERCGRDGTLQEPGSERIGLELVQDATGSYRRLLRDEPDNADLQFHLARSLGTLGVVQEAAGKTADAEASMRECLEVCAGLPATLAPVAKLGAIQRIGLGRLLFRHGRLDEGRRELDAVAAELERMHGAAPADAELTGLLANAVNTLACVDEVQGRKGEMAGKVSRACDLLREVVRARPQDDEARGSLGMYLTNLGILRRHDGDERAAERLYREAIELLRGMKGEGGRPSRTTMLATALASLGDALATADRTAAEAAFREAIALRTRQVHDFPATPDHLHQLGATEHNYALQLEGWGRIDEAIALLRQAWGHQTEFLRVQPQHEQGQEYAGNHLNELLRLLQDQHRYGEAITAADECLKLPGAKAALYAAQVVGFNMQQAPESPDRALWLDKLLAFLAEARRRGASTAGWSEIGQFRHIVHEPRFQALLHE
ncbi:MAG: protein kinase [Planctomycetota bacterium]